MSQAVPTDIEASAYASNYIKYGEQSRAFMAAFPNSKALPRSITQKASKMHKTVNVQSTLDRLRDISRDQTEEEFSVSIADIKQRLIDIADRGSKVFTDKTGLEKMVAAGPAVSALSELNKMDGNHAATKHDLTSSDGSMSPRNFNDFYDEEDSEETHS